MAGCSHIRSPQSHNARAARLLHEGRKKLDEGELLHSRQPTAKCRPGRSPCRGRKSHRGPITRGDGDPLVVAVRESALKIGLEGNGPRFDVPGTVLELRVQ